MKTRLFFFPLLACIFLFFHFFGCAGYSRGAEISHNQAIKKQSINIGRLNQEIRAHLEKIRENGKQEVNLLDELKQIDEKFSVQKEKLAGLQKHLHDQEEQLALKVRDLRRAELVSENVRRHLEKRLRSFYVMGKTGFLNVTFSKKSLPELMLFNDAFKRLLDYDQSVIDKYRQTIDQLDKAKQARELERNLMLNFVRQTEKQQQDLIEIRTEKEQLLNRIKSKKGLYEQAIREMQRAENDLTRTLSRLKRKEEKRVRGFLHNKGRMEGPVMGRLIVHFGDPVENGPSKGIIINTDDNAPVFSIYTGKIIFAGYKLGYGNMVIIDHGYQYYTVTAHLDDISVQEGERVLSRHQIGTTGDIATLFSKGLYFEIRHGAKPIDPLLWLRANSYPKLIPLPRPAMDHIQQQNKTIRESNLPVQ
jgi:septal ring factor EnvC (AmiA/AmiB activator)